MSRRLIVDDGRHQRELLLVGRMLVGRDPKCEISHGDPRLSRRHAEFEVTAEGVRVRDLQSRNGIRVNGAAVDQALLKPGDSVQVAHLLLRFAEGDEVLPLQRSVDVPSTPTAAPMGTTAPMPEDDRTRVVAASAAASAAREAVRVREDVANDRTRVAAAPSGIQPAARPAPTKDLGEMTIIRDGTVAMRALPTLEYLGVQWLAGRSWGRRVLLQGVLLALVVAAVTTIPLLAWQARTFGMTAITSLTVLIPALLAATFAGVMVASLIARTTARGLQNVGSGFSRIELRDREGGRDSASSERRAR